MQDTKEKEAKYSVIEEIAKKAGLHNIGMSMRFNMDFINPFSGEPESVPFELLVEEIKEDIGAVRLIVVVSETYVGEHMLDVMLSDIYPIATYNYSLENPKRDFSLSLGATLAYSRFIRIIASSDGKRFAYKDMDNFMKDYLGFETVLDFLELDKRLKNDGSSVKDILAKAAEKYHPKGHSDDIDFSDFDPTKCGDCATKEECDAWQGYLEAHKLKEYQTPHPIPEEVEANEEYNEEMPSYTGTTGDSSIPAVNPNYVYESVFRKLSEALGYKGSSIVDDEGNEISVQYEEKHYKLYLLHHNTRTEMNTGGEAVLLFPSVTEMWSIWETYKAEHPEFIVFPSNEIIPIMN